MASDEHAIREQNKAVVRRFYEEVVTGRDQDLLDTLVAEEVYDWHAAGRGLPAGRAGFKQHIASIHQVLGELQVTVDDLVAEGDRVVAFWTQTGIHQAPLFGFPPTGKRVSFAAVSVLRLANGQITEYRARPDRYPFVEQIGLITPPLPVPVPVPPPLTR
jgi:steroid delta-isomerase-like uncharacterized protein